MSVLAAGNLPLSHFVTDLYQPNRTQSEVLEKNVRALKVKAFAFSLLEKICYVALFAILATVFAVSYSAIALTGGLPHLLAGMALSTPLISVGVPKFTKLANEYSNYAENEAAVLLELQKIEKWKPPEINQFLLAEGLISERIPLEALRQINANEPLSLLLPLIARFNQMKTTSQKIEAARNKERRDQEQIFMEKEAKLGKPIDAKEKLTIRFNAQDISSIQHEQGAVPLALQAAAILQLIQDPTQTAIDVEPFNFEISGVGKCVPRAFAERAFGRTDEPRNDDYFVFHPDLRRPALELELIDQHLEPRELRLLLFPQAIRV